jgi:hypothetical protein
VNNVTIYQYAGESSLIVNFAADYIGYVIVSGNSTTSSGYIMLNDSCSGYPYNNFPYSFGTYATTRTIPVLPGIINVYFVNYNTSEHASAVITVTYYWTGPLPPDISGQ